MSSDNPRLRGQAPRRAELYPLGQIPDNIIKTIGKSLIYRLAIGQKDISGDDFGDIFASAINGTHRGSPLGIADVVQGRCAWSVKTVKQIHPFVASTVRLISGRNSPIYSGHLANPLENPERTGETVLSIWNARVNEAMDQYNDLRIAVLVRNMETREFLLFEEEAQRFVATSYKWVVNNRDNLEGRDRNTNRHIFTWQPHGSQFTIIREVPASARYFRIDPEISLVQQETILAGIGYQDNWITIHG